MDFLVGQKLIYTSQRYSSIYDHFRENYNFKTADLFVIAMAIGYYNAQRIPRQDKGSEFRSNYLSTKQKSAVYSMILNDADIGKNIERFDDSTFQNEAVKVMEEYAEAGMSILIEKAFLHHWDGTRLDPSYKEYEVDIMSYIYDEINTVPF